MGTTISIPRISAIPILVAITFLIVVPLHGQSSILIFPPDASDFPVVTTSFYPFDTGGKIPKEFNTNRVELLENGTAVVPDFISCPEKSDPIPVSATIAVDVSGSMATVIGSRKVIELVSDAAKVFIRGLDLSTSEAGLVTFNTKSRVVVPFTRDTTALFDGLFRLPVGEGTDYREAFIGAAGAIPVAKAGAFKPVVVMFTDGEGENGEENEIIDRARAAGVTIYVIVVGPYPRPMLRTIAEETGGLYFNVHQQYQDLEWIARLIVGHARQELPCRVTWRGKPGCEPDRRVVLRFPDFGIWGEARYSIPDRPLPNISINPDGIRFEPIPEGASVVSTVSIEAAVGPVTITGIRSTGTHVSIDELDADPWLLPLEIAPGQGLSLTVRYTAGSDPYIDERIIINSTACSPDTLYCTAGRPVDRGNLPDIRVLSPDGGEVYPISTDQNIIFSGGVSGKPFHLSYSIDGGALWSDAGERASVGPHTFTLPDVASDQCLARVFQNLLVDESRPIPSTARIVDLAFVDSGRSLVTLDTRGAVQRRHLLSGALLEEGMFPVRVERITPVVGTHAVAAERDGQLYILYTDGSRGLEVYPAQSIFDVDLAGNGELTNLDRRTVSHPTDPVIYGVRFELDAAQAIIPVLYRRTVTIPDFLAIDTLACIPRAITISPDGRLIATGGIGGCLEVRALGFDPLLRSVTDPYGDVVELAFDSSGEYLASISVNPDRGGYSLVVRRTVSGAIVADYPDISGDVRSLSFVTNADTILLGESRPTLRSTWSGEIIRRFDRGGAGLAGGDHDPVGSRYATSTESSESLIWSLDQPYKLTDLSDSLWSIVAPDLQILDVDFGRRLVGQRVDSTVTGLILNRGALPVTIRSMVTGGGNGSDFSLVTGLDGITIPAGEGVPVTISFRPGAPGPRSAEMVLTFSGGELTARLTGVGVLPGLSVVDLTGESLDFGSHLLQTRTDSVVTVENRGDRPLRIDSLRPGGPDDTEFMIDLSDLPLPLDPGERYTFDVGFTPTRPGIRHTQVLIHYTDLISGVEADGGPVRFDLSGIGLSPERESLLAADSLYAFTSSCLEPDTVDVTLLNPGSVDATIGDGAITPGLPFRFAPGSFPLVVPAGNSGELKLIFEPTTTGAWSGEAELFSSDSPSDTLRIEIVGTSSSEPAELSAELLVPDGFCGDAPLELVLQLTLERGEGQDVEVGVEWGDEDGRTGTLTPSIVRLDQGEEKTVQLQVGGAPGADSLRGFVRITGSACSEPLVVAFESVRSVPDLWLAPIDTICAGESVALRVEGAGGVVWMDDPDIVCGECREQEISPSRSGWYRAVLSDPDGCSFIDSVEVVVRPILQGEITFTPIGSVTINDTLSLPIIYHYLAGEGREVGSLTLSVDFDPTILLPMVEQEEVFSGTLLEGWTVEQVRRSPGRVTWVMRGEPVYLDANALLGRFIARVFVGRSRGTTLSASLEPDGICHAIGVGEKWLAIDSICGLDGRLIEIGFGRWQGPRVLPNPAPSGLLQVRMEIPYAAEITLDVLDISGRTIDRLYSGEVDAGERVVSWQATGLSSGHYFIRLSSGSISFLQPVRLLE